MEHSYPTSTSTSGLSPGPTSGATKGPTSWPGTTGALVREALPGGSALVAQSCIALAQAVVAVCLAVHAGFLTGAIVAEPGDDATGVPGPLQALMPRLDLGLGDLNTPAGVMIALAAYGLLGAVLSAAAGYWTEQRLVTRTVALRSALFAALLRQSPVTLAPRQAQIELERDPRLVATLAVMVCPRLPGQLLAVLFCASVMLYFSVALSLMMMAAVTAALLVVQLIFRAMRPLNAELQTSYTRTFDRAGQTLTRLDVITAYGAASDQFRTFLADQETTQRLQSRRAALNAVVQPLMTAATLLATVAIVSVALSNPVSLGPAELVALLGCVFVFARHVFTLAQARSAWIHAEPAAERMIEHFALASESEITTPCRGASNAPNRTSTPARIELRNLSFAYPHAQTVLRALHLTVRPGAHIGITGPNGSGKTTLALLLSGLLPAPPATLFVDGTDVSDQRDLFGEAAWVPQHGGLLNASLRENLMLGAPSEAQQHIRPALELVGLATFVAQHGLDTMVGEDGQGLSGGERQRLALARALVRAPRWLILDEGLSMLPPEEALQVLERLRHWNKRRCTLVNVSHRSAELALADIQFVLDRGALIERQRD